MCHQKRTSSQLSLPYNTVNASASSDFRALYKCCIIIIIIINEMRTKKKPLRKKNRNSQKIVKSVQLRGVGAYGGKDFLEKIGF